MTEPSEQPPRPEGEPAGAEPLRCVEWCPVCRTADVLRETASPELREQWHRVQREALVAMRSLIDHYLERLEAADGAPRARQVEDIPVE